MTGSTVPTAIAFAPDGKAVLGVGLSPNVDPDRVMSAVRSPGAVGSWSALDERSVVQNSAGRIGAIAAATHPNGVVLGWIERQADAQLDDLGVARFNGASFEPRQLYSVDNAFINVSVGASPSGDAIVAAQHGTPTGRFRIMVGEAQGIAGAWPGTLDEVPAQPGDHRDPRVAAGGIVAIAYGVHAGQDNRTEVVADGPSPACGALLHADADGDCDTDRDGDGHAGRDGHGDAEPGSAAAAPAGAARGQTLPPRRPSSSASASRAARSGSGSAWRAARVTFTLDGKRLARRSLAAGTRKLALEPRKKLKRGRHKLTVIAVDAAGNRSKTIAKRFRVR